APNIGIAWDPFGNGKTAVLAGYSVHYVNDDFATAVLNAVNGNAGLSSTAGDNSPVSTVSGVNSLPAAALVAAPPFLIPTTFSQNAANLGVGRNAGFAISPNLRTPYVQDWNLSIQRAIGFKTTVTVSYLGNHGTNLIRGLDINQVIINQNGFLADFNRARSNGFLEQAAGNGFDPQCTNPVPGCQPLTVFPTLPGGGFLNNGTVQNRIQTGQVGELADIYHIDGIEASAGQFTPNDLIRGGDLIENFSSSSYNAGVVQIQRRFSKDLIFQGSYTYSKVIDDADGSQSNFSPLIDNANPRAERGRAGFDLTHAFKDNFDYGLPFGRGEMFANNNGILNAVLGGWRVSSVLVWQSGAPFTFFSARGTINRAGRSGNETALTALSRSQLRDAIHLSFPTTSVGPLLIDPSFIGANKRGAGPDGLTCSPVVANGFCNPQPGQLGNLSRNEFNGPKFFDADLSILKSIPIRESMSLQLRGDAFNVFNHPSFQFKDQNINSGTFGRVNSTVPGSSGTGARTLQVGARFIF